MGTGARALVLAGGAAVVVAAGALIWKGKPPQPGPAETVAPADQATSSTPTATAPAAATATEPAASAAQTTAAPPAFDVVRVTPEGDALVAGRAAAGAEVSVKIDGVATASAVADPQGKFVAMFTLPPSSAPRVVQLSMKPETGEAVASADQVVLAPTPQTAAPEGSGTEVAAAETATAGTTGTETAPVKAAAGEATAADGETAVAAAPADQAAPAPTATTDGATTAPTEPAAAASAPTEPAATAVADATEPAAPETAAPATTEPAAAADAGSPTAGQSEPAAGAASTTAVLVSDSGAKVLQGAAGLPDNVTIGAISYSSSGAVQLSGHGKAGAPVRLYLDNSPVLEASVGADGSWSGTLSEVQPGIFTLRADQLDVAGEVTSRYETPFQREAPDVLAALRSKSGKPVNITVQPGFTLWEIAKQNYGDGVMFVRVFEANKAQIKDPDLIYPGQVFTVPKKN